MIDRLVKIKHKKLVAVFVDICIYIVASFFSLLLRFTLFNIPDLYLHRMLVFMPVDLILLVSIFWVFKLYHSIWSFASFNESMRIILANGVLFVVSVSYKTIIDQPQPVSVYLMTYTLVFVLVICSRFFVRILRYHQHMKASRAFSKNTMIIGGGEAGSMLIAELNRSPSSDNRVRCIIDDNKSKKGRYINGVLIVGGRDKIHEAVKQYDIEEIILAIPSLGKSRQRRLLEICNQTACRVKMLPSMTKMTEIGLSSSLRDVSFNDLLERDEAQVDKEGINETLRGKVVLVTGGGGSIGSEICRQVVAAEPEKLIIFDIYENNLYSIQMELKKYYPQESVIALIGSVRDRDRLEGIFEEYRPDIVYHAAAHKHVPLVEDSPLEAIKNNCGGTYNLAAMADKYEVEKFVLISTDKAVRPTNIMGATKRICEIIVQGFAKSSKTRFAAVRFGNVFGSNGSVIPLFMKQIENGGPVTVTHEEIIRYFMSIPEAVSLVLQAGILARGGEVFVLNMGEPVRIYDLAKKIIRSRGMVPGKDIDIKITGLRPGEKLYEEMLTEGDNILKTDNRQIFVESPVDGDFDRFFEKLEELLAKSEREVDDILEEVKIICPTYKKADYGCTGIQKRSC